MIYLHSTTTTRVLRTATCRFLIEGMVKKSCPTRPRPPNPLQHQANGGNVQFAVDHSPLMKENSIHISTHASRDRRSETLFNRSIKQLRAGVSHRNRSGQEQAQKRKGAGRVQVKIPSRRSCVSGNDAAGEGHFTAGGSPYHDGTVGLSYAVLALIPNIRTEEHLPVYSRMCTLDGHTPVGTNYYKVICD